MSSLLTLSHWEKTCAWLAATALSAALLGTAALIFAADAHAPWFGDHAIPIERAAERCRRDTASAQPHADDEVGC